MKKTGYRHVVLHIMIKFVPEYKNRSDMHLDSEQKRILKAVWPAALVYIFGYPILLWIFGKVISWQDFLLYLGVSLGIALLMGVFYVLGAKIPKKDE